MRDEMKGLQETVKRQSAQIGNLMSTVARQDDQLKAQYAQIVGLQETVAKHETEITQLKHEKDERFDKSANLTSDRSDQIPTPSYTTNFNSTTSDIKGYIYLDIIM